jgi:hypothetical protein
MLNEIALHKTYKSFTIIIGSTGNKDVTTHIIGQDSISIVGS